MIILGDKYTFTQVEYSRVQKSFDSITHISYKDTSSKQNIKRISNALKGNHEDLIVLNTKASLSSELITYLTKLEILGIKYITIENFLENYLQKCLITEEVSIDTSFLQEIHAYSHFQYVQKRVIDYLAVIFLFLPTLMAMLYTKYRIKRESPGGLFFVQPRIGRKEKEFTCIKLRSMHVNAESNGAQFAEGDNDPRTYPWGQTIRYTKIDELLQLWNVFKSEMHFVGPRPERKIWTDEFEKSIPYYAQRHLVAPGITGLAQIKYQYGSGKLDAKEKLMYDLYYIKNWNIFLELQIIWKTLLFVTTKKREDLSNF